MQCTLTSLNTATENDFRYIYLTRHLLSCKSFHILNFFSSIFSVIYFYCSSCPPFILQERTNYNTTGFLHNSRYIAGMLNSGQFTHCFPYTYMTSKLASCVTLFYSLLYRFLTFQFG